jgi:hypothetical protein
MTIKTQPQPPFTVSTESERNTEWPDGSRVYCKDTNKSYVLDDGVFILVGPGSGGGTAWGQITGTLATQTDLSGALIGLQPKETGKELSTNDYSTAEKNKLAGITSGANIGVVPNAGIVAATKTKITYDAKGLVTAGTDATTADIADSADKRYCTDAQKAALHAAVTVSAPIGLNTQALSILNDAAATVTEVDTGYGDPFQQGCIYGHRRACRAKDWRTRPT